MNAFTEATRLTYTTHQCGACGVRFAMEESFVRERQQDHKTWYCPNGHGRMFAGKTEAQKQQERAERLAQQLASRDEDLVAERMAHSATKGQLTKAKKRAVNGVCPCCNRSFANVARHVANKHPETKEEES